MTYDDLRAGIGNPQSLHERAANAITEAQKQIGVLHRLQDARRELEHQRIVILHEIIFSDRVRQSHFLSEGTVH